jgi:pimeloyl-ACP methyl ester carboxylesterase
MSVVPERAVRIPATGVTLEGDLWVPDDAAALVIFAHGSGSSRFSPRNRQVAQLLNKSRLATLLLDLLTQEEESLTAVTERHFDIPLLADRLTEASDWAAEEPDTRHLLQGYFGASTGAAAALVAAAGRPERIRAVVSRGGRADLAGEALEKVRAATLLIVGGNDPQVLAMNRLALSAMKCERQLVIVPGASHLFEEPGALDTVARLARDWFLSHLVPAPHPA